MTPRKDQSGNRRYGEWAGNPKGFPEDKSRCAEELCDRTSHLFYQCRRKRGHGPGGEYCKQHAKQYEDGGA